jgi:hypothetical protein
MSYVIKSVRQDNETIFTTVTYTFADNSIQDIEVASFMPATDDEVIEGIENREISEQRRLDAIVTNAGIVIELEALIP